MASLEPAMVHFWPGENQPLLAIDVSTKINRSVGIAMAIDGPRWNLSSGYCRTVGRASSSGCKKCYAVRVLDYCHLAGLLDSLTVVVMSRECGIWWRGCVGNRLLSVQTVILAFLRLCKLLVGLVLVLPETLHHFINVVLCSMRRLGHRFLKIIIGVITLLFHHLGDQVQVSFVHRYAVHELAVDSVLRCNV